MRLPYSYWISFSRHLYIVG